MNVERASAQGSGDVVEALDVRMHRGDLPVVLYATGVHRGIMFYDERFGATGLHAVAIEHSARPARPAVAPVRGPALLVKSAFDRLAALVALIVLLPVLAVFAAAVRCSSHGPALFRQTRVGRNGHTFTMLKFRTMYDGAERRLSELLASNDVDGGVLFKMREDPRITPVGRMMRRFSIDELPQLINVLVGSMSLVGPRPPLPDEVQAYGLDARRRLLVKPGLTGLWQISGRSDLSYEDAIRLDLQYVETWSLALDTAVLFKTVPAVLRAQGAY